MFVAVVVVVVVAVMVAGGVQWHVCKGRSQCHDNQYLMQVNATKTM
jgi:hypothetical protein